MSTTTSRPTFLAVPFVEKDLAKAAGALWSRSAGTWYAPPEADLSLLTRWIPENSASRVAPDPVAEFAEAIHAQGLRIDGPPIMDGKLQRCRVEGNKGSEKSGAYVGHLDGHPAGYIANHREGTRLNWKSAQPCETLTAEDRTRLLAEAEARRGERHAARLRTMETTAAIAAAAFGQASPALASHAYLVAKDISPSDLRMGAGGQTIETTDTEGHPRQVSLDGRLLVPMRDIDGKIWSIQTIDPDGTKSFHKDAKMEGCHTVIGTITADKPIAIAEGYSTGATFHELSGLPVVVAFNAGNIAPVAQAYRQRFPDQMIIIAGDNDHLKDATKNVGLRKAEAAAVLVGGYTVTPDFAASEPGTDWNDYKMAHGADATYAAIRTGLNSANAQSLGLSLRQSAEQTAAAAHAQQEERQLEEYAQRDVITNLLDRSEEQAITRDHGR